jgi:hypothetical protein
MVKECAAGGPCMDTLQPLHSEGVFMFGRLLLLAILAITCTFAQEEGGGGGGGGGGRGGGGGGMESGMPAFMPKKTKLELFAEKLKLNQKEQAPEVEKILSAAVQEAAPVRGQIERGRAALAESIINGKGDEDFKKTQDAVAGLMVQLTVIEAKAFGQVLATLKPNQQAKAGQAFELLDGYFDEAQAAAGGRGRGAARGPGGGGR